MMKEPRTSPRLILAAIIAAIIFWIFAFFFIDEIRWFGHSERDMYQAPPTLQR